MWNNISVYLVFCEIIEFNINYMCMLNIDLLIILSTLFVYYYLYKSNFDYIHTITYT